MTTIEQRREEAEHNPQMRTCPFCRALIPITECEDYSETEGAFVCSSPHCSREWARAEAWEASTMRANAATAAQQSSAWMDRAMKAEQRLTEWEVRIRALIYSINGSLA